jgi:dTDP-4-dehydrorhamnose reductase
MAIPRRIMLLGAAGQIGQALQRQPLPPDWRLGLYGRAELDVTLPSAMRDAVQSFKPDLVINAAAMTDIEEAERNPDAALAVNFHAVSVLAAQCSTHDIPLIHLSTDNVFDGQQTTPYLPEDPMNPINVCGQSKLLSEEAVRHELPWHVILRLSWVFGAFGDNIMTRILHLIDEQETVDIAAGKMAAPTPAPAAANAIIVIANAILDGRADGFGTFHFCGLPPCTLYDFAVAVMEAYAPHTSSRPAIRQTIDLDFASTAAPEPGYSVLDCAKIRKTYSIEQPLWRGSLAATVVAFLANKMHNSSPS